MRIEPYKAVVGVCLFLVFAAMAHADTYSTFETTRYYSANHRYVVKITPNKRATLYRRDRSLQRVWSRMLSDIPSRLFVSDDGGRVVMIDHYYGNGGSATTNVVLFFDEHGNQIGKYSLGEVANLPRVLHTTSSAHWYYGAFLVPYQRMLIVETVVRKCEPTKGNARTREEIEELEECMKPHPYEELQFSMATGKLISRVNIEGKYIDPETRLTHELELVKNEQPQENLAVTSALLNLARFYQEQKQYAKAKDFYEKVIPINIKVLGEDYTGDVIGEAATNYRNLGEYRKAEQFYRWALISLDKNQGNPRSVRAVTITVYEEYAELLRKLNRKEEAERMIRRAKAILAIYPDYKVSGRR